MQILAIGCEYSGVTTLLEAVGAWGKERDMAFHLDDHFSIPDTSHLEPEDQEAMVALTPALKERFQRMQVVYHLKVLENWEHVLLGGFHIEHEIYGPLYYHPGRSAYGTRQYEHDMPEELVLVHLKARPEVIEARMAADPHPYQLILKEDIATVLERFEGEYRASLLRRKIEIDTSDLAPEQLLATFLRQVTPHLNTRDMLRYLAEKLEG